MKTRQHSKTKENKVMKYTFTGGLLLTGILTFSPLLQSTEVLATTLEAGTSSNGSILNSPATTGSLIGTKTLGAGASFGEQTHQTVISIQKEVISLNNSYKISVGETFNGKVEGKYIKNHLHLLPLRVPLAHVPKQDDNS